MLLLCDSQPGKDDPPQNILGAALSRVYTTVRSYRASMRYMLQMATTPHLDRNIAFAL